MAGCAVGIGASVRGRVTDIGKAPGAFDAAFIAAGHILGIEPRLLSYNVASTYSENESALRIRIDVELQLGESTANGSCSVSICCVAQCQHGFRLQGNCRRSIEPRSSGALTTSRGIASHKPKGEMD